jgi:hypothetical protein
MSLGRIIADRDDEGRYSVCARSPGQRQDQFRPAVAVHITCGDGVLIAIDVRDRLQGCKAAAGGKGDVKRLG